MTIQLRTRRSRRHCLFHRQHRRLRRSRVPYQRKTLRRTSRGSPKRRRTARIRPGKSDAIRNTTASLISSGVLSEAEVAKAEVDILGMLRTARVNGLADVAIEARGGKEPPTPEHGKAMQLETLQRLRMGWGDRLPEVKAATADSACADLNSRCTRW